MPITEDDSELRGVLIYFPVQGNVEMGDILSLTWLHLYQSVQSVWHTISGLRHP